ncbi:CPBP family intramembrane metalloprotease [Mucilaginibacter robiniae]|uniref:CPBP family intramembrane metalloprotease n=1 Tax=Mucilaginibacter robiniae TaxID=2728022 RepID=A0A7L5DXP8_9SPHI|nr:CPBP family intramembrane glutamic endopeptidase [Mucilaginibacter robiniae]QJD95880.1 CPBP family intramembrane metalloprotease [Mucilaginibacter robiniae]
MLKKTPVVSGPQLLRPYWAKLTKLNSTLGIVLILLLGIPRFIIVLHANVTGNYSPVSIVFLCMWLAPFLLLNKQGRRTIGIKKPSSYLSLLYSFLIGAIACFILFVIGDISFGKTYHNCFVYIAKSYSATIGQLNASNRLIYFIIYAVTSMTFSPIGEELFYRGIVHQCFVAEQGENKASIYDSLAFGLTHLAHFGIVYIAGVWKFLFIPSILWVLSMFLCSRLFYACKVKSGSIFGAMMAHAGFNLTMIYLIFYRIL